MNRNHHGRQTLSRPATTLLMLLVVGCSYTPMLPSWPQASARLDHDVPRLASPHYTTRSQTDVDALDGCFWNGPMYGVMYGSHPGVPVGPREYLVRRIWTLGEIAAPCITRP